MIKKTYSSFFYLFISFFLLLGFQKPFSYQKSLNIKFDITNLGFVKGLQKETRKEFNIISKLIKSLVITKNKSSVGTSDPQFQTKRKITCNNKKEYYIPSLKNASNINFLFIVANRRNSTQNFKFEAERCGDRFPTNKIIILEMYNFYQIKERFYDELFKNQFRWKVIKVVLELIGMNPSNLLWENIRYKYLKNQRRNSYYESFKKYLRLIQFKRSLNYEQPNYKFGNDTVHKGWWKLFKINDILLGEKQGNYAKTAFSEMSANIFDDILEMYKLNRYDFFPINKRCLRLDKKCLHNDDLIYKYYVDYSFSTNINQENAKMIYYMNTYKTYLNKKCALYYGDLLDKKFLDENHLTFNYNIKPKIYNYRKKIKKGSYPGENGFYFNQRTYLLKPSPKCPNKHPRTVFFVNTYNNKSYEELKKEYDIDQVIIKDPRYFMSYSVTREREIFAEVMTQNNFLPRNLSLDENVIWYPVAKERSMHLNKYQLKYRYFHSQLFKDGLWRHYSRMAEKFPNDYNFVPKTYIYPENKKEIIEKFKDYHFNPEEVWMFKPSGGSEGSGIYIIKDWDEIKDIKSSYVLNKYLTNPYLIYKKKFDFRHYVLITGIKPLKIYLYKEGYVRFPTEEYNLDPKGFHNPYIHITNTVQNEKNVGIYSDGADLDDRTSNVWRFKIFEDWAKENNVDYDGITKKFSEIFIKMIIAFYKQLKRGLKKGVLEDRNVMQIYGYDMMLDENLNPVLIEINSKPGIAKDNRMETWVHFQMVPDMLNIKGVVPFAHDETLELFDKDVHQYKDEVQEAVDNALCEFERPSGLFERIFPLKENIEKYRKFFEEKEPENELLWETMLKQ